MKVHTESDVIRVNKNIAIYLTQSSDLIINDLTDCKSL